MQDYAKPKDVTAIIAKRVQAALEKYPKGALSHRDVLITLAVDESKAAVVDAAITDAIWSAAAKEMRSVTAEELINAAKRACNLKVPVPRNGSLKSFMKVKD